MTYHTKSYGVVIYFLCASHLIVVVVVVVVVLVVLVVILSICFLQEY